MARIAKIDRSTLRVWTVYQGNYVLVNAFFEAPMVSGGRGQYKAIFQIDPKTKGLTKVPFAVAVAKRVPELGRPVWGRHDLKHMDRSRAFCLEVRDIVVGNAVTASRRWSVHLKRGPNPKLTIGPNGEEILEGTDEHKNYMNDPRWGQPAPSSN
jgi:hypothetical protein